MEANQKTIADIFNGSRVLEIPFFQRAYVWDKSQWEKILSDIEDMCETGGKHFIGSLILKQQLIATDGKVSDIRTI